MGSQNTHTHTHARTHARTTVIAINLNWVSLSHCLGQFLFYNSLLPVWQTFVRMHGYSWVPQWEISKGTIFCCCRFVLSATFLSVCLSVCCLLACLCVCLLSIKCSIRIHFAMFHIFAPKVSYFTVLFARFNGFLNNSLAGVKNNSLSSSLPFNSC